MVASETVIVEFIDSPTRGKMTFFKNTVLVAMKYPMTSGKIKMQRTMAIIRPTRRFFRGAAAADDDVVVINSCRSWSDVLRGQIALSTLPYFLHVAINSDRQQGNSVQKSFPQLTSANRMKISIVVPAFNEEKLLQATLERIKAAAQSFHQQKWELEIIVCDNNSTDRTAEIARDAGAKVVFEPINQIGRARNCGAAAATGDWLLFIDADSFPGAELLGEVAKVIASGKAIAGGSTVRLDSTDFPARLLTHFWNLTSRILRWVAGSFIFCETTAFRAIGGFSNEFFTGEELDLSKRLKRFARAQRKRIVIISKFPLITSARKIHLYRRGELGRFFLKAFFHPNATMKNRDACSPWYDGRR